MAPVESFSRAGQPAKGPATVLAIGTANPPNIWLQDELPDLYFRLCKSEHMKDLKMKFKKICEKSMIRKRHISMSQEFFEKNPSVLGRVPSLNDRLNLDIEEVPKLGAEAAAKAIEEWGRPKSCITHVVFHTYTGMQMPGVDYHMVQILGLEPTVNRFMIYFNGCYAGATTLRLAKDIAENNAGARVLVVCSESTANGIHGPSYDDDLGQVMAYALFGDGAAAMIVGADPDMSIERPLFQLYSATQSIIPNSEGALLGRISEVGFVLKISKDLPGLISKNIESQLVKSFEPLGVTDWNSLFWIVHPGGVAILNAVEDTLGLKEDKLKASRHILSEYGNMSSPTIFFIMDEMRRRSQAEGKATTGEGCKWGGVVGVGPGLTMETIVLRSLPTN